MLRPLLVLALGVVATLLRDIDMGTSGADSFPPALVQQGQKTYQQFCLYCHGPNMVNTGENSYDLRRFPHDQRERFYSAVIKGKGRMPAWGDVLTEEELQALWAFVSTGGRP